MNKIIQVLFLIFFVHSQLLAQNEIKEHYFAFKTQALALHPYEGSIRTPLDSNYELENNSFIYGFNAELNYYTNTNFGFGLGLGYEHLNQPDFYYYPIYLNVICVLNDTKNAIYTKLNIGAHLGDLDQPGSIFRWGLGSRIIASKHFSYNFEFTYSFQNMYKSFNNSQRRENYYNIESIGITLGIEIR